MHESRIPGWQAIVRDLFPFYKENVWYLVAVSIVIPIIGVLPIVGVLAGYAIIAFGFSVSGAGIAVLFGILAFASFLWLIFITGVAQIATVRASISGRTVRFGRLIGEAFDLRASARVVLGTVLNSFFVMLGFILLIVPGIYILVRGTYLPYALVHEGLGPVEAIKRSWSLTRGYWWATALRFGWLLVVIAGGSSIITLLMYPVGISGVGVLLDLVWQVLVVGPFMVIFSRRMYELVRDGKAKDAEAFHRLAGGEKWQIVGIVVLVTLIGALQSAVVPTETSDAMDGTEFEELQEFLQGEGEPSR